MMARPDNIGEVLNARRKALGMSIRILATRCGLSVATVQRVLGGKASERAETVFVIASVLGMAIELRSIKGVASLRREVAAHKAHTIVNSAQGSFALEGQSVPEAEKHKIEGMMAKKLLNGPNIRLWS